MKHALLSDIHGNLEALNSVLQNIAELNVDTIHCLGDVIGYGADPSACIELVEKHCRVKLLGNHEFTALGLQSTELFNTAARESAEWTRCRLKENDMALISDYELDCHLDDFYLVHGSPYQPNRWHYIFTVEEAYIAFDSMEENLGFVGHSHVPNVLTLEPGKNLRSKTVDSITLDKYLNFMYG